MLFTSNLRKPIYKELHSFVIFEKKLLAFGMALHCGKTSLQGFTFHTAKIRYLFLFSNFFTEYFLILGF